MGIDWTTIKSTISSQIATLAGLDSRSVRWVDEPSGNLSGALPVVWLRIDLPVGVGVDYEQRTDGTLTPTPGQEQAVTVVGQRQFTLKIRVESFTPDISDDRHAANIGEAIRTRLRRSTSIQARAGAFAVSQILMAKKLEYVEADRPISTYLLDVLCLTVDVDTDTTVGAGDWIGEVQGSGTVKNNDGSTIDSPAFDVSYTKPPLH